MIEHEDSIQQNKQSIIYKTAQSEYTYNSSSLSDQMKRSDLSDGFPISFVP